VTITRVGGRRDGRRGCARGLHRHRTLAPCNPAWVRQASDNSQHFHISANKEALKLQNGIKCHIYVIYTSYCINKINALFMTLIDKEHVKRYNCSTYE
jgi:hypothetical protein